MVCSKWNLPPRNKRCRMATLRTNFFSSRTRVQVASTDASEKRKQRLHILPGAEVVTFLPLQVTLYFNVYYSPLWAIASILTLTNKYSMLATHYKFVAIVIYIVMFIVEVARLYLGYEGNLREKVPDLAGFWLLTLLQAPLTLYLLANVDTIILPLERAVNIVLLIFLVVQLFLGFGALQLMVKAQAVKFHLSNFDTLRTH